MRILQVIPSLGLAGAERMLEGLSVELVKLGHEVCVGVLFDEETSITENLRKHDIRVEHFGKRLGFDARMVLRLRRFMQAYRPDAIHTHRYAIQYAAPASVGLDGTVRVHTVHALAEKELGWQARTVCKVVYGLGFVTPVAINGAVAESITAMYGGLIVPIICNGVAEPSFDCVHDCSSHAEGFTFVHIGRFSKEKNHDQLVRAFVEFHREYPDARLLLVGTGPLKDRVKELVVSLGASDYIELTGLVDDMNPIYARADAVVLPSLYEGMSMTLIEAMMRGIPVLASRRGGNPDLVQDGTTGYLCEIDANSIAHSLERLLVDRNRSTIARNGRDSVQKYSARYMAKSYVELYSHLQAGESI